MITNRPSSEQAQIAEDLRRAAQSTCPRYYPLSKIDLSSKRGGEAR